MGKPLVLVTSDTKELNGFTWHAAIETYLTAVVSGAEAFPVLLPSLGASIDIDEILQNVDGVLATGALSNVNPKLYGQVPTDENGPYDDQRDATTLPLLRTAVELKIPVFAICRGMQELNVALGGTLLTEVQTIPGRNDHRAEDCEDQDVRFSLKHPIQPKSGGILEKIIGSSPIQVNSLHRQAVDRLGKGLKIEAQAEDGTIEAISGTASDSFLLATQWHPEYWVTSNPPSMKVFEAFGDAVRAYRNKRLSRQSLKSCPAP